MVVQQNSGVIADRTMGPFFVIISAPSLRFLLVIRKGQDPVGIEGFGPEAVVEGVDEHVVGRLARTRDKVTPRS